MKKYFLALCLFIIPIASNAQMPSVIISEIAWMGTDADANNEWIELYNFGSTADITGWTLYLDDSLFVTLSGELPGPHRVSVLERTDDATLPDITALFTYTGALPNSGGTITLRNQAGDIIDTASGGSNWSGIGGGNVIPKKTAQRTNSLTWVTATPTPGAANAQVNDPVATTTTETDTTTTSNTVQRSGGGSSSRKIVEAQKEKIEPVLALTMNAPKAVYVNQVVDFEVVPSGVGKTVMNSLMYMWNFGDTYTGAGKKVKHVFEYPGEYVVIAHGAFAKQDATVRQEIKVLPVSFTLSRTSTGDILLENNAPHEVDLEGFALRGVSSFTFPKFTIMKAGGTLTISKERVGSTAGVSLFDTQNVRVATDATEVSQIKNLSSVTPLFKSVPPQPLLRADTTEVTDGANKPQETIIQIGNTETVTKEEGLTKRFFKKFASLFGF